MHRQIIYPGQIPLDTDLLNTNKNAMIAIAKLSAAALGVNGVVNGLSVVPTGPASLNVNVNPGEIYQLANIDGTSYGSLAADTTHQVLKQGVVLDVTLLSCPAPGTGGQSINYLVQAVFSETDTGSVALPYYNSSNPAQAWSGPNNTGTPQATQRSDNCVVTVKAGAAATTGSQVTPTPDANNIGLAVVTVANGQATITAGNIVQYTGAALVPSDGLASNVVHAIYSKSVAGAADVTLTAQEAAYPILTLTGALTGNINLIVPASSRQRIINNSTSGAYQITVKTAAGTGVVVPQGYCLPLYCDGTNVLSTVSALLTQAQGDARYTQQSAKVRQTVFQGPVDTAGLPTFLAATFASLIAVTQNVSTGLNALIATAAGGTGVLGDLNVVGQSTSNLTWPACTANNTNYLPVSISGGVLIPQTPVILAPIYQWGGTPAVTAGQYTFNIQQMTMYLGNGSTAPAVNHVIIGEVVAGASTITSTVAYALMGRYTSPQYGLALSGAYTYNHNVGVVPTKERTVLVNITAEAGATSGMEVGGNATNSSNNNSIGYSCFVSKNSFNTGVGATALYVIPATGGAVFLITPANWKLKTYIDRGW